MHDDHLRRAVGPLPHGQKRAHAELLQLILLQNFDLKLDLLHRGKARGKIIGGEDIGGLIDQIAGEEHAFGKCCHGGCRRRRLFGFGTLDDGLRVFLDLCRFAVFETVAAQGEPERNLCHAGERAHGNEKRVLALELRHRGAREPRGCRIGPPFELHDLHRACGHPRGEVQHDALALLDLAPAVIGHQPVDRALGQPVDAPPRRVELALGRGENGNPALEAGKGIKVGFNEINGERGCHGVLRTGSEGNLVRGPGGRNGGRYMRSDPSSIGGCPYQARNRYSEVRYHQCLCRALSLGDTRPWPRSKNRTLP